MSVLLIAGLYIALVIANVRAGLPSRDEGLVAIPASNLVHHGFMGTTIWAEQGSPWSGINRRTYNTLPLGILYLAAWYSIVPATILATRMALAGWIFVLAGACFVFLKRLTGDSQLALLATAFIGLDYKVVTSATYGRVDLMTAALGMSALAIYCTLRERTPRIAVFAAYALVTLASLTHPMGVLYFVALVVLVVYLDRGSLSPFDMVFAALPIVAAVVLWGLYLAQDPTGALRQLQRNSVGQSRLPSSLNPLFSLRREWERYLVGFSDSAPHAPVWPGRLKMLLLLFYAAGIAGVLATPYLRRQRSTRAILLPALSVFATMTLFDNSRFAMYLVHIVTWYCMIAAAFVLHCWRTRMIPRMWIRAAVAGFVLISVGGLCVRARIRSQENGYQPAVAYLRSQARPEDLVVGNLALWFDYGDRNLQDDPSLGVRSGLVPEYIVEDPAYAAELTSTAERSSASALRLRQYSLIYDYKGYRIFRQR